MSMNYLVGPVTDQEAWRFWQGPRQAGVCRVFNSIGSDLRIDAEDSWEQVCRRLPPDWRPDCIVLQLSLTTIPPALWTAPIPLIGLAGDWDRQWHAYRHVLPLCDVVLTDAPGVDRWRRAGFNHVRAANLNGLDHIALDWPHAGGDRSLDVLYAITSGDGGRSEHRPWLSRLARLADRWRVAIRTDVSELDFRDLLGQARIVFNPSAHGECNRTAFEAVAAGALLFQEVDNREVPRFFRPGREYVAYTEDNLETLLEHYLRHEEERQALAEAARKRVRHYRFETLWQETMSRLQVEWGLVSKRARRRLERLDGVSLQGRILRAANRLDNGDPALARDLEQALAKEDAADLHNSLGLAVSLPSSGGGERSLEQALVHFRRAVESNPRHVVAAVNLSEALAATGRQEEALAAAERALAVLERDVADECGWVDAGLFAPGQEAFLRQWERAAWTNAGQPVAETEAKRHLLCWRLHSRLAGLTRELDHYRAAARAWPESSVTQARLGCALGLAGESATAAGQLQQAVRADPFDHRAARALYQALTDSGDTAGARRLARDLRRLAEVAPQQLPLERWFLDTPPVGDELASLVLVCANRVDSTRLCVENLLKHTRSPYELIVIDNGSLDGTPAYLKEVRGRPGPARVEVLRNSHNLGAVAACNQALARARGRYVVFLDTDVVVTPGWLDGLVGWALHDWPQVGLVGAVGNGGRGHQQVGVNCSRLEDLTDFALRRRREQSGRALDVERLAGFCLLARREVFERVERFDERGGPRFFEDFSVRVRQAGFRLLVALNVFVHQVADRQAILSLPHSGPQAA
jgi:tetratricopeptide (TPR) repeat protein